jgi:hypothetical protein
MEVGHEIYLALLARVSAAGHPHCRCIEPGSTGGVGVNLEDNTHKGGVFHSSTASYKKKPLSAARSGSEQQALALTVNCNEIDTSVRVEAKLSER